MRTYLSICTIAASISLLAACGGATPPPATAATPAPAAAQPTALKAPGEATIGDRSTCPVSGEEFVIAADSPKVEHEGKTFYFCCSGCAQKFQADPAKYVKKPAS
jgi:YHS domain-containing protein